MTSDTATALAEAFREHRDAFGASITFGSTTVTAIVGEAQFARDLVEGGFADAGTLQVKALLSDFTTVPAIGSAVTYEGRSFRVAAKSAHTGGLIGEFEIRPAKR